MAQVSEAGRWCFSLIVALASSSCDIFYVENPANIVWKKLLKEIKQDVPGFYQEATLVF